MKLTDQDKELIISWGYTEKDFWQIEKAIRVSRYELEGKFISRRELISMIGREEYLSGICRSAFHGSAARMTEDGKEVNFDSWALFH